MARYSLTLNPIGPGNLLRAEEWDLCPFCADRLSTLIDLFAAEFRTALVAAAAKGGTS